MNKTDKAKLMHNLGAMAEKLAKKPTPEIINSTMVGVMFFLHMLNPPATFGGIVWQQLKYPCSVCEKINFVCDTYTVSIKDLEISNISSTETAYQITGPDQTRPKDWTKSSTIILLQDCTPDSCCQNGETNSKKN